jgi:hypothetical protein
MTSRSAPEVRLVRTHSRCARRRCTPVSDRFHRRSPSCPGASSHTRASSKSSNVGRALSRHSVGRVKRENCARDQRRLTNRTTSSNGRGLMSVPRSRAESLIAASVNVSCPTATSRSLHARAVDGNAERAAGPVYASLMSCCPKSHRRFRAERIRWRSCPSRTASEVADVRQRQLSLPAVRLRWSPSIPSTLVRRDPNLADTSQAVPVRRLPHAALVAYR